jgi:hypothetical protein
VAVAPALVLDRGEGALTGAMSPELAGTEVTIERLSGASWEAVGSAAVGDDGRFTAQLDLVPGVYRARVGAVPGLVAGTSPKLTIDAA